MRGTKQEIRKPDPALMKPMTWDGVEGGQTDKESIITRSYIDDQGEGSGRGRVAVSSAEGFLEFAHIC